MGGTKIKSKYELFLKTGISCSAQMNHVSFCEHCILKKILIVNKIIYLNMISDCISGN